MIHGEPSHRILSLTGDFWDLTGAEPELGPALPTWRDSRHRHIGRNVSEGFSRPVNCHASAA
jgi:hypothetical protein